MHMVFRSLKGRSRIIVYDIGLGMAKNSLLEKSIKVSLSWRWHLRTQKGTAKPPNKAIPPTVSSQKIPPLIQ